LRFFFVLNLCSMYPFLNEDFRDSQNNKDKIDLL
jgi:hypothetical protein